MEKRMLSKSQIQLYLQCPLKWRFIYINKIPSIPSPQQTRGLDIHSQIENFYKNVSIVDKKIEVKNNIKIHNNFLKFEEKRLSECSDLKYFFPLHQELKIMNNEIMLRGIIDAVYLNSKDDKIIIIDWKSGKFHKYAINDYRFELSLYAYLFNNSNLTKEKVKYIGMYFVDEDKLFFEEVKQKYIDKMLKTVDEVRKEIEKGTYLPKKNFYCDYCEFQDKCYNITK